MSRNRRYSYLSFQLCKRLTQYSNRYGTSPITVLSCLASTSRWRRQYPQPSKINPSFRSILRPELEVMIEDWVTSMCDNCFYNSLVWPVSGLTSSIGPSMRLSYFNHSRYTLSSLSVHSLDNEPTTCSGIWFWMRIYSFHYHPYNPSEDSIESVGRKRVKWFDERRYTRYLSETPLLCKRRLRSKHIICLKKLPGTNEYFSLRYALDHGADAFGDLFVHRF